MRDIWCPMVYCSAGLSQICLNDRTLSELAYSLCVNARLPQDIGGIGKIGLIGGGLKHSIPKLLSGDEKIYIKKIKSSQSILKIGTVKYLYNYYTRLKVTILYCGI